MDKPHKSMKRFLFMVFRVVFAFFVITSINCRRADDAWNHLAISNQLPDTLVFQSTKRYHSEIPGPQIIFIPNSVTFLASALHNSGLDLIRENWGNQGDTIEIYRNNILIIKWGGPLRIMPDNIHHFFNQNSWEMRQGGRKNQWTIATFTITESDIGYIEGK